MPRLAIRAAASMAFVASGFVGGAPAWGAQPTVPPPTPVPPAGSPSPFPTELDTPDPSTEAPELTAASATLVDLDSGQLLYEQNARERRPIASVTKVMTALLVLEAVPPEEVVTVSPSAASQSGAVLGLEAGEEIPVRELLYALMLQSANDAAVALAEHVGGTVKGFVDRMNQRARQLRLRDTRFASSNGLDDTGYSSARDLAVITAEAYRNPTFGRVVRTKFHEIPAPKGPPRSIQSRNALLWLYPDAIGVKTGYTFASGFCLVAAAARDELRLGAVILGAPRDAFSDAGALLNHGFAAYERRVVVEEGQSFDPLRVEGRDVPVAADVSLTLLLRRGRDVDLTVEPEAGLTLPVAAGERVGTVVAAAGDRTLGEVPLVAQSAARAPEEGIEDDPWWERAWDAVTDFFRRMFRAIFG
ncbi:MAG: D-alanyl-D-alanine carboxypeptidase family protein [Actinomycetota bacterium]